MHSSFRYVQENALRLLAALFLFALLLPWPPATLTPGLDSSWEGAIDWLARHGNPLGGHVFFTYGPLGHFYRTAFYGAPLAPWYVFRAIETGAIALFLVRNLTGKGVLFGSLGLASATWAAFFGRELLLLFLIWCLAERLLRPLTPLILLSFAAALAILALVKFTFALAVGVALAVVSLDLVRRGLYQRAGWVILTVLLAFASIWKGCGLSFAKIPKWLEMSFELTAGYPSAMSLQESNTVFSYGFCLLLLVAALPLFLYFRQDRNHRKAALTPILLYIPLLYLAWKHGITRAPGHTAIYFGGVGSLALCIPSRLELSRLIDRCIAHIGLVAILVLSVAGIHSINREVIHNLPWRMKIHLVNAADWATGLSSAHSGQVAEFDKQRASSQLPAVRSMAGSASVDVFGHEQSFALYNDLTYKPRPILQSYSVYTPKLIEQNARYFRSEARPDFVLLKLQGIDGNISASADAGALREILRLYRPCLMENGFLLLRAVSPSADPAPPREISPGFSVAVGSWFELPTSEESSQCVRITLSPTLWGRMQGVLYKNTLVTVALRFSDKSERTFRLNPLTAKAGILTYPWLENSEGVLQLWTAPGKGVRVEAMRIMDASPRLLPEWKPAATICIVTDGLKFSPLSPSEVETLRSQMAGHRTPSLGIEASQRHLAQDRIVQFASHDGALVLPGDWIEFQVPSDASRLTGEWGLLPGSYTTPNRSDGMGMRILCSSGVDGPWQVLSEQTALPSQAPVTREPSRFGVHLPSSSPQWLRIEFDAGPSCRGEYDWGFLGSLAWAQQ